jgi:predicted transposase YbfD/YdcC
MDGLVTNGPLRFFLDLPDPRAANIRYRLIDLIVIAICAIICDCDSWDEVEDFAESKKKWFTSFLELDHGIPSCDTFERVFARLDPQKFESCFVNWMSSLVEISQGKLLAIDGKSIRRSFEKSWDKAGMAHMVSLFATENGQVLRQLKTEGKGSELPAILDLLKLVDLKGALVTIDAIACQKEVAETITDRGGDYILCVKENQPTLHESVKKHMDELIIERKGDPKQSPLDHENQIDSGHGRLERRKVWVTHQIDWLKQKQEWPGLASLIVVEASRTIPLQGASMERRYYISSLKEADAKFVAQAIRGHWAIENTLHHVLDVSFHEDESRVRKGHGPENLSRLRRIALNLIKVNGDKLGKRKSIKGRRKIAGWDHDFLLGLITH